MIAVPERFRPEINVAYPEGNKPIFEEWFYHECADDIPQFKVKIHFGTQETHYCREYLPIFWTSFWVNHKYGKDFRAKTDLLKFVTNLDRSKKYFTIVQYDDGTMIPLPSNIKVFAMSGPRIDYPLPLICQPHKYSFNERRDLFCNFVGRITHPIRKQLLNDLSGKSRYYTSSLIIPTEDFCKVLASSVFTLCPRGYGQTSFRICEALQYGSIPVYISDQFIIPHNVDFNEYGVLIDAKDVHRVDEILSAIPENEIRVKQWNGKKIYNELFSFEGCKKLILDNI